MKQELIPKKLLTLSIFLAATLTVFAQDYMVTPLSDHLEVYKGKQVGISKEIGNNSDLSVSEKLALYENEMGKLKEEFKKKRKLEYQAKSVKRAKRHKCKGTKVRGVTKCPTISIVPPNDKMYTKQEWLNIEKEGVEKSINVSVVDSKVDINISATGTTRENKATVFAIYKYKPELISDIVNDETMQLFDQIVKSNDEEISEVLGK